MKERGTNKKAPIKALIFDVGGVLQLGGYSKKIYRKHRTLGVHNYISRKVGVSLDQYFDSIDVTYAKSIEGTIPEKKVSRIFTKNLKIPEKKLKKLFNQAYKKNFKFNKQLFKQALKLKKHGYKIAILSDQWHLSKKALIPDKFFKKFDKIVVSCDVGIRKPNLQIYRLILKKIKIPAKDCIFIDNQEWNLKPAKKLGMKTILFQNNKQLFKQLSKLGIQYGKPN